MSRSNTEGSDEPMYASSPEARVNVKRPGFWKKVALGFAAGTAPTLTRTAADILGHPDLEGASLDDVKMVLEAGKAAMEKKQYADERQTAQDKRAEEQRRYNAAGPQREADLKHTNAQTEETLAQAGERKADAKYRGEHKGNDDALMRNLLSARAAIKQDIINRPDVMMGMASGTIGSDQVEGMADEEFDRALPSVMRALEKLKAWKSPGKEPVDAVEPPSPDKSALKTGMEPDAAKKVMDKFKKKVNK